MTGKAAPKPPAGLQAPGRGLWRRVIRDLTPEWEFDQRELALLEAACRQLDAIEALEAAVERDGMFQDARGGQRRLHPAVPEIRQARVVLQRLLGAVELPSAEDSKPRTAASERAQVAAHARWAEHNARKTARG